MHVANIRAPRVTKRCMIYVTGSSGSGKRIQGPGFLQLVHEGEQSCGRKRLRGDWNKLPSLARNTKTTIKSLHLPLFLFYFYFWLSQKLPHLTCTADIAKEGRKKEREEGVVYCICLCRVKLEFR